MSTTWLVPKNNASGFLGEDIADDTLEFDLETGNGAAFPSTFPFRVVIGSSEVVEVTGRTTDTLTVTRAAESTAATAHFAGETVLLSVTAGYLEQVQTAVTALETGGGDLSEPGPIGGTTPNTISGTTITATTGLVVSRAGETTAGVTLTNSTGSGGVQVDGTVIKLIDPAGNYRFGVDSALAAARINGHLWWVADNTRDIGAPTTSRPRHLYLSGDAYIGGGDIFGPDNGDLTIRSDQDIVFQIDTDAGTTPGAHKFSVKNGAGDEIFYIEEDGSFYINGPFYVKSADGIDTLFNVPSTGIITLPAMSSTYGVTVGGVFRTSNIPTFAGDDTTPNVETANIFITATAGSAVTITTFDGAVKGQPILILPTASPVTTIDSDAVVNMDTDWLSSAGTVLRLTYDGVRFWKD